MSYNYSVSADFTDGLDTGLLLEAIKASSIATAINYIKRSDDTVEIQFSASLSAGEETTLGTLVANHNPVTSKPRNQHFTVYPKRNSSKTTVYIRSHVFNYLGSLAVGPINYFDLSAYLDSGTNTYDARIINTETGAVLVEKTGMNNRFLATHDLGPISNIPTAAVDLELQIRKQGTNNNTTIEIESLVVYYGN